VRGHALRNRAFCAGDSAISIAFARQTAQIASTFLPIGRRLSEVQFASPLGSVDVVVPVVSRALFITGLDRFRAFNRVGVVARVLASAILLAIFSTGDLHANAIPTAMEASERDTGVQLHLF
jgi:hypothetical protein